LQRDELKLAGGSERKIKQGKNIMKEMSQTSGHSSHKYIRLKREVKIMKSQKKKKTKDRQKEGYSDKG